MDLKLQDVHVLVTGLHSLAPRVFYLTLTIMHKVQVAALG